MKLLVSDYDGTFKEENNNKNIKANIEAIKATDNTQKLKYFFVTVVKGALILALAHFIYFITTLHIAVTIKIAVTLIKTLNLKQDDNNIKIILNALIIFLCFMSFSVLKI